VNEHQIPDDESGSSGESHTPWHLMFVVAHLVIIPIVLVILQDSPQRPPRNVQFIKSDSAANPLLVLPTLNTSKLDLLKETDQAIWTKP